MTLISKSCKDWRRLTSATVTVTQPSIQAQQTLPEPCASLSVVAQFALRRSVSSTRSIFYEAYRAGSLSYVRVVRRLQAPPQDKDGERNLNAMAEGDGGESKGNLEVLLALLMKMQI